MLGIYSEEVYLIKSVVKRMRSFLINKNLSFYYWLKKRIGKKRAYRVASVLEKVILIFGREDIGGIEDGRV